jgi:3-hydroxybutyryl-CoA dehydrogenase
MPTIEQVAVIGAGTMGRQISLQIARSGVPVVLYDSAEGALDAARAAHKDFLAGWIAAGTIKVGDEARILAQVDYATDLATAVGGVELVIEVVPERVEVKRAVFTQLDQICRPETIIATNSSSIRVSLLEDATTRPDQVANFHFYLPVWDNPMVEIGGGTRTTAATLDALTVFARRIGMLPLRVRKESTGFIFNRVWRAIKKETLKVVDSGIASFEDVDRAWMIKYGTPYGPFGQMDEIGLDVVCDIETHYARESGDPADLPPPVLTERVARGDLGRKTGRGFYTYPNPTYMAIDFLDPGAGDEASV